MNAVILESKASVALSRARGSDLYTVKQINECARLYDAGLTFEQVAARTGIPYSTVYWHIVGQGGGRSRRQVIQRRSLRNLRESIDVLRRSRTVIEAAERLGMTPAGLKYRFRNQAKKAKDYLGRPASGTFDIDRLRRAVDAFHDGETWDSVSRVTGHGTGSGARDWTLRNCHRIGYDRQTLIRRPWRQRAERRAA